jgi:hypothetical protein
VVLNMKTGAVVFLSVKAKGRMPFTCSHVSRGNE